MSDLYLDRLVMIWWHMNVPGNQGQKVTRNCKTSMVITNASGNTAQLVARERSPLCS